MWLGRTARPPSELGAYLTDPYDADRCFEAQLVSLMVGAGDTLEAATASVAASQKRFTESAWSAEASSPSERS